MARPRLDDKEKRRKHPITIYCTADEAKKIRKLTRKTNHSMSEFCKRAMFNTESILNKYQVANYMKIVGLWSAISGNVNQMAKAINAIANREDAKPSNKQLELIQVTKELIEAWNIKSKSLLSDFLVDPNG